jgi:hypothetical protein
MVVAPSFNKLHSLLKFDEHGARAGTTAPPVALVISALAAISRH